MASGVVVLGARDAQKAQLMVWISEDLVKDRQLHAGNLVKHLAKSIDGGGGGQPFYASAGGSRPDGLADALAAAAAAIAG
jgi:alanyl-tRNA synthetase